MKRVMMSDEIGSDEEQDHVMKNVDSDEIENNIEEQVLGGNDEHDETDDEALIYMFTEEYISLDEESIGRSWVTK